MARKRRSAATAAGNWQTRTTASANAYKSAVSDPTVDWVGPATSQATTQLRDQHLQAAINNGSINAGMQRAGNAKWSKNTSGKGVTNWTNAVGTQASKTAYQDAMQIVEADYAVAEQAMNASGGDPGTTQGRITRAGAWAQSMHDQKVARGSRA